VISTERGPALSVRIFERDDGLWSKLSCERSRCIGLNPVSSTRIKSSSFCNVDVDSGCSNWYDILSDWGES
jgi:hypothetical protein